MFVSFFFKAFFGFLRQNLTSNRVRLYSYRYFSLRAYHATIYSTIRYIEELITGFRIWWFKQTSLLGIFRYVIPCVPFSSSSTRHFSATVHFAKYQIPSETLWRETFKRDDRSCITVIYRSKFNMLWNIFFHYIFLFENSTNLPIYHLFLELNQIK